MCDFAERDVQRVAELSALAAKVEAERARAETEASQRGGSTLSRFGVPARRNRRAGRDPGRARGPSAKWSRCGQGKALRAIRRGRARDHRISHEGVAPGRFRRVGTQLPRLRWPRQMPKATLARS
jgi:hypothetical protein